MGGYKRLSHLISGCTVSVPANKTLRDHERWKFAADRPAYRAPEALMMSSSSSDNRSSLTASSTNAETNDGDAVPDNCKPSMSKPCSRTSYVTYDSVSHHGVWFNLGFVDKGSCTETESLPLHSGQPLWYPLHCIQHQVPCSAQQI